MRLDLELEPRGVTREAQRAGRVVDEAGVVEHSQAAPLQVLETQRRGLHGSRQIAGECDRQRVDGEVAAQQILRQWGAGDTSGSAPGCA